MGKYSRAIFRATVSGYANFIYRCDAAALKHWWDVKYASKTAETITKVDKHELKAFVSGIGVALKECILRGELEKLPTIFVNIMALNPEKLTYPELNQLDYLLELPDVQAALNQYLYPERMPQLQKAINDAFSSYVLAHPERNEIVETWKEIHETLTRLQDPLSNPMYDTEPMGYVSSDELDE